MQNIPQSLEPGYRIFVRTGHQKNLLKIVLKFETNLIAGASSSNHNRGDFVPD
jgi:hypothetical protein